MKAPLKVWSALLHLLETQYADDITVTQLCAFAGVHRSTFYRHFHDIFDVVDFGIGYQLTENALQRIGNDDIWPGLDFVCRHRTALRHLITVKYAHRFQQALCRSVEKQVLQGFQAAGTAYISAVEPEWMARFYVGGGWLAILTWLQNTSYNEKSVDELRQQCILFREQTLRACLKPAP